MKKVEESISEAKDKKGTGSGTKDACYNKVKSRYSVWPSAYASGALVKCRKVGAANWGNKSEEVNLSDKLDEKCWKGYEKKGMKTMFGKRYPNCVKKKATNEEAEMVRYCPKCEKNETRDECSYGPKTWDMYSVPANLGPNTFEEKYERIQRLGKTYTVFFTFRGQYKSLQFFFPTSARPSREEVLIQLRKIYPEAVLTNYFERDRVENEPLVQVEGAKNFGKFLMENNPRRTGRPNNPSALERIDAATPGPGAFTYHGFKEKHGKKYTYNNPHTGPNYDKNKTTYTQRREYIAGGGNAAMKDKNQTADQVRAQGRRNLEARPPNPNVHNWKDGKTKVYAGNPPMRFNVGEGRSVYGSGQLRPYDKIKMGGGKLKSIKDLDAELDKKKGVKEDWQSVNKKDKTDGMSPKAVAAYRRENPGSKLKTAVTGDPKPGSKDAKRRKSYCARSKGQQDMHNIDCSKTPDKPVCKARKRWKC